MLRAVLAPVFVASLAATAHAQPGNYTPPPPPKPHVEYYPLSVAGVDLAALGLVGLGTYMVVRGFDTESRDSDANAGGMIGTGFLVIGAGVLLYPFGAAIVHHRHHNDASAWKSMALRLGLPMVGGFLCGLGDGTAGAACAAAGVAAAVLVDWAVLSKHEVVPYAGPIAGGGATFGFAGTL